MAEYFPCPWCGRDVTTTPPAKVATERGLSAGESTPGVSGAPGGQRLWDRNGVEHSEGGCTPVKASRTELP